MSGLFYKRVLWISRHPPSQEEREEMVLLLGAHTVAQVQGVSRDPDAIPNLLEEHQPDQVGMPLPWRPIWQHRGQYDQDTVTPDVFRGFDEILEMRYRKRRIRPTTEGA